MPSLNLLAFFNPNVRAFLAENLNLAMGTDRNTAEKKLGLLKDAIGPDAYLALYGHITTTNSSKPGIANSLYWLGESSTRKSVDSDLSAPLGLGMRSHNRGRRRSPRFYLSGAQNNGDGDDPRPRKIDTAVEFPLMRLVRSAALFPHAMELIKQLEREDPTFILKLINSMVSDYREDREAFREGYRKFEKMSAAIRALGGDLVDKDFGITIDLIGKNLELIVKIIKNLDYKKLIEVIETDASRAAEAVIALRIIEYLIYRCNLLGEPEDYPWCTDFYNNVSRLNIRQLVSKATSEPRAALALGALAWGFGHVSAEKSLKKLDVTELVSKADGGIEGAFDALADLSYYNRKAFKGLVKLAPRHPEAVYKLYHLGWPELPWYARGVRIFVLLLLPTIKKDFWGNPRRALKRLDSSELAERAQSDKEAREALFLIVEAGNRKARNFLNKQRWLPLGIFLKQVKLPSSKLTASHRFVDFSPLYGRQFRGTTITEENIAQLLEKGTGIVIRGPKQFKALKPLDRVWLQMKLFEKKGFEIACSSEEEPEIVDRFRAFLDEVGWI